MGCIRGRGKEGSRFLPRNARDAGIIEGAHTESTDDGLRERSSEPPCVGKEVDGNHFIPAPMAGPVSVIDIEVGGIVIEEGIGFPLGDVTKSLLRTVHQFDFLIVAVSHDVGLS
jgi:hypothetical protein